MKKPTDNIEDFEYYCNILEDTLKSYNFDLTHWIKKTSVDPKKWKSLICDRSYEILLHIYFGKNLKKKNINF